MNKQWWKESVVYQIYPRSFMDSNGDGIGDIRGITEKLDYLKALGIDVIWLSPIYESPNDDNGYDISHYQKIMDAFGTMEDFDELLKETHQRGMKIIMDLVVNHTSDEHPWFKQAKSSRDNPYRDYYIWREGKNNGPPNNWEAAFSGSAWNYNTSTDDYYLHLFSPKQPDLNWENPQLRKEIYHMMKWWLDKGIDGFRMDVINFISKDQTFPDGVQQPGNTYASGHAHFMNGPRVHAFLQEMNEQVLSHYDILTVGEMPGVTPEEGLLYTGEKRKELHMVFHFEHMDMDSGPSGKWDITPWSLVELKEILTKWQVELEDDGWNSLYWNNHDQPRVVSRFGNDKEYRVKSAKMLATTLHMMKGTPYIYQGEEIGMTNVAFQSIQDYRDIETINMYKEKTNSHIHPDTLMNAIHGKSRDNARTPMQWDDSKHGGFTTGTPWINVNPNYSTIHAAAAMADEQSIFHHYKKLIQLRKQHEIIVYGSYKLLDKDNKEIFAYMRSYKDQQLLVISNFSHQEVEFSVPLELCNKENKLLISNTATTSNKLNPKITLTPYESCVYII